MRTIESSTSASMIKLIARNYSIWKSMMEDLVYCKELYDLLESKALNLIKQGQKSGRK